MLRRDSFKGVTKLSITQGTSPSGRVSWHVRPDSLFRCSRVIMPFCINRIGFSLHFAIYALLFTNHLLCREKRLNMYFNRIKTIYSKTSLCDHLNITNTLL